MSFDTIRTPHLRHPDRLFIAGRWVEASSGRSIDVISASAEVVVASVAEADEADVDAAVAAAREAFDHGPWPRLTPAERAGYLRAMQAELQRREPDLADAWVEQIGALAAVAPFVIGGGTAWFGVYADMAETFPWQEERGLFDGPGRGVVLRDPVGVVAAIAPWNNPYGIMTGKIAPALLAGCTVVMKPAPETPMEAYILAEAAEAAGVPPGVINLVTAHRDVSDHLVRNAGVDKVSFTGSVVAGARIASVCGARIARCTLELGGKSAAIVLDDFDIESAANTLAQTITMSAGQICATLSRAIVPAARKADFVAAVEAAMRAITVGHPRDPATQMGPLAIGRQRDRVEEYVGIAVAEGARLVTGGGRPRHLDRGFYFEPTLFADVDPAMRIAHEEVFGPVLAVLTHEGIDDAIAIANTSDFGLYGAVFTDDGDAAMQVMRGMRAGTITQNAFRFDTALPFGGFKRSGLGREGGREGLAGYTELKSLIL